MGRRSRPVLASGRAAVAAGGARLRRRGRSRRRGVARRRHPLRPRNPRAAWVRSTVTSARRRRWARQGRSCPPPVAAAAEWPQIVAALGLPGSRVSRLWSTAGVARPYRTVTRADCHGLDQLHARAGVRAAHPAWRHPGRTRPRPGRPRPAFNQLLPITAETTSHEPRTNSCLNHFDKVVSMRNGIHVHKTRSTPNWNSGLSYNRPGLAGVWSRR
jgi:hypothetical protein